MMAGLPSASCCKAAHSDSDEDLLPLHGMHDLLDSDSDSDGDDWFGL